MAEQSHWTDTLVNGDLDDDANYSDGKPEAGDEILFLAAFPSSATVNGDNLTAIAPDLVSIARGYPGQIGTSAEPLEMSPVKLTDEGSGALYFKDGGGTTGSVYINSGNTVLAAQLSGNTINFISVMSGRVELLSTLGTIPLLFVGPGAIVDIQGTNTYAFVSVDGGTVTSKGAITDLRMNNSKWTQWASGSAIASLDLSGSSKLEYWNRETITTAVVGVGSTLDVSKDTRAITITNAHVYPGGTLLGGPQLTVTNRSPGTLLPWLPVN